MFFGPFVTARYSPVWSRQRGHQHCHLERSWLPFCVLPLHLDTTNLQFIQPNPLLRNRLKQEGVKVTQRRPWTLGSFINSVVTTQGTVNFTRPYTEPLAAGGTLQEVRAQHRLPRTRRANEREATCSWPHLFTHCIYIFLISKVWVQMFMIPAGGPTGVKAFLLLL